jgi:hypothetical protein
LSVLGFTSPASATFTLGRPGSFTVTTSLPSSAVSIALSGSLPPDVSYNVSNGTATLSGIPTGRAKTYSTPSRRRSARRARPSGSPSTPLPGDPAASNDSSCPHFAFLPDF